MYGVHVDVFSESKTLQYVFTQKELNLLQKRWLELLKDYDMSVLYYPGKANVVADVLSRMTIGSVFYVEDFPNRGAPVRRNLHCYPQRRPRLAS